MYTELDKEYTKHVEGVGMYRVTIQVDTAADLPEPDASWEVGSICIIANTHAFKMLNSEKEWV